MTMNKKFMMALCLTFIAMGSYGQEQKSATSSTETSHYYLQIEDVASSLSLLPAPPQPGSAQFLYDQYQYLWGKAQRDTPRGDVAVTDARVTGDGVPYAFSEAFGITISKETTPEIYTLITHMREDAGDLATRGATEHYIRTRPFKYYDEQTCNPEQQQELCANGSYPSGHTSSGGATALIGAGMNVGGQNEILKGGD